MDIFLVILELTWLKLARSFHRPSGVSIGFRSVAAQLYHEFLVLCAIVFYDRFLVILLMEEILHQLACSLSHYFTRFYTSQVVQDFFHQQYHMISPL